MAASPDANVGHFYYKTDLMTSEPIDLPSGTFFKSRRSKDEDVAIVDGQLTVVSTDVTTITQNFKKDEHSYDYGDLKKEVKALAKKCKDNNVKLNGDVVVFANGSDYFRLRVVDNVVKVEGAVLGWPSGGVAPMHANW